MYNNKFGCRDQGVLKIGFFKIDIRYLLLWLVTYVPNTTKGNSCLFLKKKSDFALYNRRFNKLSNDTKFVKIEVILLKVQALQSVHFLLFSLYFTHCFVHYLRHKPGRQDVPFVVLGHIICFPWVSTGRHTHSIVFLYNSMHWTSIYLDCL